MALKRRDFLGIGATALAAAGPLSAARGDTFPSKAIRWVIPFAPGGNYDVTSRIVADPMSRQLGQTVIIDNKPGAGGVVGLDAAVQAPADGYTLVMASFTVGYVAPIFAGKQQMLQQLAPVSILTTAPTIIVVRAGGRFADAKAAAHRGQGPKPGTVTIGHSGNGTTNPRRHPADAAQRATQVQHHPLSRLGTRHRRSAGRQYRLLLRPAHQLHATSCSRAN